MKRVVKYLFTPIDAYLTSGDVGIHVMLNLFVLAWSIQNEVAWLMIFAMVVLTIHIARLIEWVVEMPVHLKQIEEAEKSAKLMEKAMNQLIKTAEKSTKKEKK